jgi:hypothetical protein
MHRTLIVAATVAVVAFVAGAHVRDVEAGSVSTGRVNLSAYSGNVGISGTLTTTGSVGITGTSGTTGLVVNASGVNATAIRGTGIGTGNGGYFKGGSSNSTGLVVENQAGASFVGLSVTNTTGGWGVFSAATSGRAVYGSATTGSGVYAESTGAGAGLTATSSTGNACACTGNGSGGDGLVGTGGNSASSFGVLAVGVGSTGHALMAQQTTNSTNGVALTVQGDSTSPAVGAIRISTMDADPTSCQVGDLYVTTSGVLKICTATTPTWVNVGSQ